MSPTAHQDNCKDRGYLLWDMAGTLIPFDPNTGAPEALPGCDEFLPELGQKFHQVVTTGDQKESAASLLDGFGMGCHFEHIFGDLFAPVGKPFGAILRQLGGSPACSLAIGDRLKADIASDTDQVVTILVNQGDDTVSAGLISLVIGHLERADSSFPEAFAALCRQAQEDRELAALPGDGEIVQAWLGDLGFPCRFFRYRHPVLDGDRLIIQI